MKLIFSVLFSFFIVGISFSQNPPQQPSSGPGGNTYAHNSFSFTKFGTDISDCYWLIEPDSPKPDSAEVIIFWHGTTSQTNIDQVPGGTGLFLEHLVKKGYTVIFPLYQYGTVTLPFQQQLENGAAVVNLALDELSNGANHVRPKKFQSGKIKLGAVGISRGGGMTVNAATFHTTLSLPSFDALSAIVPSGGITMQGIDPTTKVLVINSDNNELNYGESKILFDSLYHIPCSNKHFIQVNSDSLGTPVLTADHSFAGTGINSGDETEFNTLDFYGAMKWSTALFDCTFKQQNCEYCLGSDPLITTMGMWSNGTPVNEATIMDDCFLSIEDNPKNQLNIFPNPADDFIKIDSEIQFENLAIVDLTGRIVLTTDFTNQIDLRMLEAGHYILLFKQQGVLFHKYFIKQ